MVMVDDSTESVAPGRGPCRALTVSVPVPSHPLHPRGTAPSSAPLDAAEKALAHWEANTDRAARSHAQAPAHLRLA